MKKLLNKTIAILITQLIVLGIVSYLALKYSTDYYYTVIIIVSMTLLLFFKSLEVFFITALMLFICMVLYLLGQDFYYIKVGELTFITLIIGTIKYSKVLFSKPNQKKVSKNIKLINIPISKKKLKSTFSEDL